MAPPLVSVIMPCFNAGPMLRPAMLSVLAQTHPAIELIFVDNNSTDSSLAVAREVAASAQRPVTIVRCAEQGGNHARNYGYGHARGDYIQWLDADDEVAPTKIALQVEAMEADPAIDIAYCDWIESLLLPGKPPAFTPHGLDQEDDQITRALAGAWYPLHAYLLRRQAADRLQAVQAWRPDRRLGEDIEYSAMAALMGLRFRHVLGAKVRYNVWSITQATGGGTAADRPRVLGEIWRDLRALPPQPGVALTAAHKLLLAQDWVRWRMPAGGVRLEAAAGRRTIARAAGRTVVLRPREADLVRALLGADRVMPNIHFARALNRVLPSYGGDPAAIVRGLERLQAAGLMERALDERSGE